MWIWLLFDFMEILEFVEICHLKTLEFIIYSAASVDTSDRDRT